MWALGKIFKEDGEAQVVINVVSRCINLTNLPLILALWLLTKYNGLTLNKIFNDRLSSISSSSFYNMIVRLPDKYEGFHYQYKHRTEVISSRLIQNHLGNVGYICVLKGYIWYYPHSNLASILISFHILRQYHNKVGLISVSLMWTLVSLFQFISLDNQVYYYFKLQIIETLMHSSLFHYFNKLALSKSFKEQWCDTRFGMIIGLSLPIILIMETLPQQYSGMIIMILSSVIAADLVWYTTELKNLPSSSSSSSSRVKLDYNWIVNDVYYQGAFNQEKMRAYTRSNSPSPSPSSSPVRARKPSMNEFDSISSSQHNNKSRGRSIVNPFSLSNSSRRSYKNLNHLY